MIVAGAEARCFGRLAGLTRARLMYIAPVLNLSDYGSSDGRSHHAVYTEADQLAQAARPAAIAPPPCCLRE